MSNIPYLGLNPFSEQDAPFFFGRDEQKRKIARNLKISHLTLLFGESGVGKSSILQAGVVPLLRRDAEQNRQDFGTPQFAIVVFREWHGKNPLKDLLEKIRVSVAEAMGIKLTDLKDESTPAERLERLKVWTKILGGKEGRGKLLLILDQFEEYFQSHPQEFGEGTFADEFPSWVNRSDLGINFLIAMRKDAHANLYRFQGRILDIFDNQIELERLNRSAARDAIVKPIGEYNLRQIVADHLQTSRLTVLSAASGMGKSPILKAIAGNLRGSITFSSWQGNPVADLVSKVEADLKALFPDIPAPEPGTSLTETLQRWTERISGAGGNSQLFIILDQFEEFFQYQPPEMEEGSFVAEFSRAVTQNERELPVHFLISIHDEARDLLKHFQKRIPNIFDHLLKIKPLGENPELSDLVKPIKEPAQKSSKAIDIEPELVEEVLNQLSTLSRLDLISVTSRASSVIRFVNYIFRLVAGKKQEAGRKKDLVNYSANNYTFQKNVEIEAPLLQLVMERLWTKEVVKKPFNCRLHLETLKDLSIPEKNITGAQRIANEHLSEQMQALSSNRERNAMAIVFKYLVSGGGTKIAYPVLNLPEDTGLDRQELQAVLDQLDAQRILRTVIVPNDSKEKRYEIFHDILGWPILNWRDRYLLNKKLMQGFLSSLIGGGIILGIVIYLPYENTQMKEIQEANTSLEEAEKIFEFESRPSGQIVGLIEAMDEEQPLSKLLNNKFLPLYPTLWKPINEYQYSLISSLDDMLTKIREKNFLKVTDTTQILSVIFSSDGQSLNIISADGSVRLWNLEEEKPSRKPLPDPEPAISSVSFSSDGKMLAIGSADGSVSLWDLGEEKPSKQFRESVSNSAILSVSFSSNGKMLAIGSDDGSVSLWEIREKKPSKKFRESVSNSAILSVSFSGDGQRLATVSADDYVRLWNLEGEIQGKEFLKSKSQISRITPISFSSNGKMLAIGSADGSVRLWNLEGEQPKRQELPLWNSEGEEESMQESREPSPESAISSISFSRDGQRLAVAYNDGYVRLWNLEGKKLEEFLKFKSPDSVKGISFSSNGKILANTDPKKGTIRLWDIDEKPKIDNNDLNKLLKRGCDWLDDYLETHPEDKNKLSSICENK